MSRTAGRHGSHHSGISPTCHDRYMAREAIRNKQGKHSLGTRHLLDRALGRAPPFYARDETSPITVLTRSSGPAAGPAGVAEQAPVFRVKAFPRIPGMALRVERVRVDP
jgi:hypothetical protein